MNRRHFHKTALSLASLLAFGGKTCKAQETETPKWKQVSARKNTKSDWKSYSTRTIDQLEGYVARSERKQTNEYGGIASQGTKTTGYWHVERIGSRFWLIDPQGGLNIHRAVSSVNIGSGRLKEQAFQEKFANDKLRWARSTAQLLRSASFNGTGAWSDNASISSCDPLIANTLNLNLMSKYGSKRGGTYQQSGHRGYPNDCIFVFDPEFIPFCDQSVAEQVGPYKDNPHFLGYYTDNELPLRLPTLDNYLNIESKDDPGRKAAEDWVHRQGVNKTSEITDLMREVFLGFLMDRYTSIVAGSLKKHDLHHLNLGPRLHGSSRNRRYLMEAVGKYADVISFNYYDVWTPQETHTRNWTEWSGRPILITEWYTKGEDSGMKNSSGAGWNVKTQRDRGLFYENFTLALLECRNCIGWHWFKYQDNDPTATGSDPSNLDSNKGVVNNAYEPYNDLLASMGAINSQTFDLIDYFD